MPGPQNQLIPPDFEVGRTYRRRDIHAGHGGQQQGGISTPQGRPYLLLFTGTGEHYGYHDGWDKNGVFLYSGEGQIGDMKFTGGNKAIRDHSKNGKDLHLFEQLGGRAWSATSGASPARRGAIGRQRTDAGTRGKQSSSISCQLRKNQRSRRNLPRRHHPTSRSGSCGRRPSRVLPRRRSPTRRRPSGFTTNAAKRSGSMC
jgi:hypothetical protein